MSDNYVRVLPDDPAFVPELDTVATVLALFRTMVPDARSVTVVERDAIEFLDPGENFERVQCPNCGTDLATFEDGRWWANRMDESYRSTHFADRRIELPCCETASDLAQLDYIWPAGFARWSVDCWAPGRHPFSDDERGALAEALGRPVRVVYQRI